VWVYYTCKLHFLTFLSRSTYFAINEIINILFHYLFALRESLNVFSEVQNALNANKMRCLKKTAHIAATKCWLQPVNKNL